MKRKLPEKFFEQNQRAKTRKWKFFNLNQVATEISSALIGSIAILACVPLTALISAYLIKHQKKPDKFEMEQIDITE